MIGVIIFFIFCAPRIVGTRRSSKPVARCNAAADDFGDQEEQLRQFDMDMKFGPCIGVTRLQRWDRASAMGLQPPAHLRDLLLHAPSTKNRSEGSPSVECLWEGKV